MFSLIVCIFGLIILGTLIPNSCEMDKVDNWDKFQEILNGGGGPKILALVDPNNLKAVNEIDGHCKKVPSVKCYYGVENLTDTNDSFFVHFKNNKLVTLVFFKGNDQKSILVGDEINVGSVTSSVKSILLPSFFGR